MLTIIFRYHKNCYTDFVNRKKIQSAMNQLEDPFNHILKSIRNEEDKIWSSRELLHAYKEKGGTKSNTTRLIERIKFYMRDEIYCFKAAGLATIEMHKLKASMLKLVNTNEGEEENLEITKISLLKILYTSFIIYRAVQKDLFVKVGLYHMNQLHEYYY